MAVSKNYRKIDDVESLSAEIASDEKYKKHAEEFRDPALGPVQAVHSRHDLQRHVYQTLISPDTRSFRVSEGYEQGTTYFYNQASNTYIVVPGEKDLKPSVYRPEKAADHFQMKIDKTKKYQSGQVHVFGNIYDMFPHLENANAKNDPIFGLGKSEPQLRDITRSYREVKIDHARTSDGQEEMPASGVVKKFNLNAKNKPRI